MNCKYLSLLLFVLLQTGCGSFHNDSTKELKKTTSDNDPELITAKKAVRFIEFNQLDSLKLMFPQEIRESAPDSVWQNVILEGQKAISNSDFPSDSLVQVTKAINLINGRRQAFAQSSFPFTYRATNDSTKYINLITSKNQLYGLDVDDYPFGLRPVEPVHTEPHLENHNLDYNSITWFRIWYVSGFKENEFGDNYGYYAVSGDKEKLEKLEIKPVLSDIFGLINSARVDSTDYNHLDLIRNGKSEYIYLRFKLDKEPYNDLGEFTVYFILEEEPEKPEELSEYIVVKHSKKTRYLYKKKSNPELVQRLKDLSYRDFGRHQEKRWY